MYENENVNTGMNTGMNADTVNGNTNANASVSANMTSGLAGNDSAQNTQRTSAYFDYTNYGTGAGQGFGNGQGQPESTKGRRKKEKKPGNHFFRKVVLCAGLGLCFGVFAAAGLYVVQIFTGPLIKSESTAPATSSTVGNQSVPVMLDKNVGATQITYVQDDISDMVEEVMPAMVSIINNYTTSTMNFWGQTMTMPGTSSGSGIIVGETDEELLIVSNNHVVEDATSLEVTFIDGNKAEAAIKGLDSDMDLAVISVKLADLSDETKSAITVATLGDSDNLKLGEPVVAIGNALGYGQSVTNGIVSALNREIEMDDGSTGTFIQTNAAINPGNSGGALLNINGEVIGINASKIGGSAIEGMGYAIPISSASPIIADLMSRQTRDKVDEDEMGYMGITMQGITDEISTMYGMPRGIFVYEIEENSPADKAGLKKGDIIVKFDGQRISSIDDMKNALQYFSAGETTTVTVKRSIDGEYEAIDLEITLGERPKNR